MDEKIIGMESIRELKEIIENLNILSIKQMEEKILQANRIFVCAAGRSFLAMKFFAMRLMQLGFATYIVGEVCTPSIKNGDLLIIGSGSGETQSMQNILDKAIEHGAKTVLFTKNKYSSMARKAESVIVLNTKEEIEEGAADEQGWDLENYKSIRPSGNPFEQGIVVLGDAVICGLMLKLKRGTAYIAANHANLE